jgi:hypothetical protein
MLPRLLPAALLALALANTARAELVSLDFHTRQPFAGGKSFGDAGPYDKLVGVARFAVDPSNPRNGLIVDLKNAPRNAKGLVEFAADVFLLRPRDPAKGNGALFYDVNNRGNKVALRMFNSAPGGNDPTTEKDAGNGFLFRRGYAVLWCGWIGELLPGGNRLLLQPPVATDNGKPITGLVRHEMSTDRPADSLPLPRREGHGSYRPTARGDKMAVLTWRMRETDVRVPIPRAQWSLETKPIPEVKQGVKGTLPQVRLKLAGGFRPGYLYELVCESEGPIVQGLGFVAVRDLVSFLQHDTSERNPLLAGKKSAITRAYGFGVSQSGRFLRHLLYQGFNVDERGRRVFAGLIPHVAGGGLGYFNHRFAQPTRFNGQHEDHRYPCDVFPFTYGDSQDEFAFPAGKVVRRRTDGILRRTGTEDARLLPRILHTQSAAEYWHRSGSLVHTDTLGREDVPIPDNVRIYAFGGTQHGPAANPPTRGLADNLHNPGDYRPQLRALLDALDAWVREDRAPPPSVYPRIDQKTLVDWRQKSTGFPALPGVRYPEVIQEPPVLDLGEVARYRVLVPRSGPDGNDLGCLLPLEVAVPVASYTGWNLRRRDAGAEGMLAGLLGSYFPLPRTEAERKAKGDPRESLEKRYGSFTGYRKRFEATRDEMVKKGHLLAEDAERLTAELGKLRPLFAAE